MHGNVHSVWVNQRQPEEQTHLAQGERWHNLVAQRGSSDLRTTPRDANGAATAGHRHTIHFSRQLVQTEGN